LAAPPGLSQPHTSFIGHPAPRHPPCALHNLTNTPHTTTHPPHHATTDHPEEQHHRAQHSQQAIKRVSQTEKQRHSRTLYKSQTTHQPHPTHTSSRTATRCTPASTKHTLDENTRHNTAARHQIHAHPRHDQALRRVASEPQQGARPTRRGPSLRRVDLNEQSTCFDTPNKTISLHTPTPPRPQRPQRTTRPNPAADRHAHNTTHRGTHPKGWTPCGWWTGHSPGQGSLERR
jgi:hypothetical protein